MTIRNLPRADVVARPGVNTGIPDDVLQKWLPDLRASEKDDEAATISILDVIGEDFWGDGVSAKRIAAALRSIGDRDVIVSLNSPGGNFFEGLAIYNALRDHKGHVTVKILGLAASAASVIAMAGDRIEIGRSAFLMIHNTWIVAMGNRHDLREAADWLEPFDATSADLYAARTGLDRDEIASMLDSETWIGGAKAVDDGWADALLPSDEVEQEGSGAKATLRAEKRFDMIAARAGLRRGDGRELLNEIKKIGGKPGAASQGTQDAVLIAGVTDVLTKMRAI